MIVINDYRPKLSEWAVLQILTQISPKMKGPNSIPEFLRSYYTPKAWAGFFIYTYKLDC